MRILFTLLVGLQLTLLSSTAHSANDWKPLWADGAPGATGTTEHDIPAMLAYPALPDTANGCSVLVCPSGGYGGLAMDHEGHQIARKDPSRLMLIGKGNFQPEHVQIRDRMETLQIPHTWLEGTSREHSWHSGWLPEAFDWLPNASP